MLWSECVSIAILHVGCWSSLWNGSRVLYTPVQLEFNINLSWSDHLAASDLLSAVSLVNHVRLSVNLSHLKEKFGF